MLLCVTATSMAAIVSCGPPSHPVGMVSRPPDPTDTQHDAKPVDTNADAGNAQTTEAPDYAPVVGTTARVPDAKK